MKKKTVVLFTNVLPTENSEVFVTKELEFVRFLHSELEIKIVSFHATPSHSNAKVVQGYPVESMMPQGAGWLSVIQCLPSSFVTMVRDFFMEGGFNAFQGARRLLLSVFRMAIARAWVIRSRAVLADSRVLYFYWADKAALALPSIREQFGNRHFVVVRFHSYDLYVERAGGYLPIRRSLLNSADLAAPVSEQGRAYLCRKWPGFETKIEVHRLGVSRKTVPHDSINVFRLKRLQTDMGKDLRIVTCSNVVMVKRLELLANAISLMQNRVDWTHIGDGPLMGQLLEKTKELEGKAVVRFMGRLANREVVGLLDSGLFDLFVNVSKYEGLPVSIMEAMMCGLPVLATNVGGVNEIVGDTNGYLLDANATAQDIAEKLDELSQLKVELLPVLSRGARETWQSQYQTEKNISRFYSRIV